MQKVILLLVIIATVAYGLIDAKSVIFGFLLIICTGIALTLTLIPIVDFMLTLGLYKLKSKIRSIARRKKSSAQPI
jgi:hypothetical protein